MPGLPGKTEADSDYDGPFSTFTEYHSFGVGFAAGFVAVLPVPRVACFVYTVIGCDDPTRSYAMREARAEGPYALTGVVFGVCFGVIIDVVLAAIAAGAVEHYLGLDTPLPDPASPGTGPGGPRG